MGKNTVRIDARAFSKSLDSIVRRSEQGKKLKDLAKVAAQPWKEAGKQAVYTKVKRRSGGLKRGITVRQLKSQIGAVAGANFKSKGGWKAHFFRSGGRLGRIDWQSIYATKTPLVKQKFNQSVINYVLKGKR